MNATQTINVLIIEDDTLVGIGIKAHLEMLGHHVIGQAANANQAKELFAAQKPDLLLVDIHLDGIDGIELLGQLTKERRVPALIVTAYTDRELIDRAVVAGVFGYLIKPVSIESLAAQIEIALSRFDEQKQLIQENQTLVQTLEERKSIEKAKGIFMRRFKIDEPAAHKRLQQESQKRRIAMGELAKQIIAAEEMLGGT
jgi:AmiR/NasT family two-component response regulator